MTHHFHTPRSPDFNPSENLWDVLRRLYITVQLSHTGRCHSACVLLPKVKAKILEGVNFFFFFCPIGVFLTNTSVLPAEEGWKNASFFFTASVVSMVSPVSLSLLLQHHVPTTVRALPHRQRDLHVLLLCFRDLVSCTEIGRQRFI